MRNGGCCSFLPGDDLFSLLLADDDVSSVFCLNLSLRMLTVDAFIIAGGWLLWLFSLIICSLLQQNTIANYLLKKVC